MNPLDSNRFPTRACEEVEGRLLDYLENRLTLAARPTIEAHLKACAACQALARDLRALDAALVSSLKSPVLSADFDARLRQRLDPAPAVPARPELAARKKELQAEFEAQVAALRRKSAWALALLDGLGYGVLAGVALWLVLPLVFGLAASGGGLPAATPATNLLVSSAVGVLFLLVGFGVAFAQPLRRNWVGR